MKSWIIILATLHTSLALGQATNVYVTPSGTVTGNCPSGTASAPNLTAAQFSTSGNWGTGTGKIGAGTTVLICGAFTSSTANATLLLIQGSGSSGSPITLLFDTNASLTNSSYWGFVNNGGGAISGGSQSYITINGGTNGLIQNTGNGTGLANEQPSTAIAFGSASHIIIENLTIANICQHTSLTDTTGCSSGGNNDAAIGLLGTTSVTVQNNVIHDSQNCIFDAPINGANGLLVAGNTLSHCNWGVGVAYSLGSGTATGITISKNDISDASNWDTTADIFHHNGIHVYDTSGTGGMTGVVEANNYIHGVFTNSPGGTNNTTAWIFNDDNTGQMTNFLIYNNVLVNGDSFGPANGYITGLPPGSQAYNNTFWGNGFGTGIYSSPGVTIENNVFANMPAFISVNSPTLVDYNQYMTAIGSGCSPFLYGGGTCAGQATFAAWKTACGCDSHGAYNAADTINSNGTVQSGSPVIGAGSNLTSLDITALNSDFAGNARPASAAWDAGAYNGTSTPGTSGGIGFSLSSGSFQ